MSGAAPATVLGISRVTHAFNAQTVLDDVSLDVRDGEIVGLLGPSGCGKSTLLRTVAGFVRQSRGEIRIKGRTVDRLAPGQRNIGIVFQNYALFPHMSAAENVAYGLRARGTPRAEIAPRVAAALDTVRMAHLADRRPRQLSGGQQQRVALARALVTGPSIILLDEPFAALDKNLRGEMQAEIRRLQRERGLTAILVTHDQEEAMSVADRIAVMNAGRVEQVDSPARLYDHPANLFVNGFVGAANLLPGFIAASGGGRCTVQLDAGATVWLDAEHPKALGQRVVVSVRPEHLLLHDEPGPGRWEATLQSRTDLGGILREELRTRDGAELVRVSTRLGSGPRGAGSTPLYCALRDACCANLFDLQPHKQEA